MILMARTVRCDHTQAVPVESVVTGEILAALCPGCDQQLPAAFLGCTHDNAIDIPSFAEPPGRQICNDCGTVGWYGDSTTPSIDELVRDIPLSWL
jgi:hypothetical protein